MIVTHKLAMALPQIDLLSIFYNTDEHQYNSSYDRRQCADAGGGIIIRYYCTIIER